MDLTSESVAKAPPLQEILGVFGGRPKLITAFRLSEEVLVKAFLETYDSLPLDDRDRVPIEAIVLRGAIDPSAFLGSAILALREYSATMVKLLGITGHPAVMEKTIEFAQQPAGVKDREQLHTMLGALQPKQGLTIFQRFQGMAPSQPGQPSIPTPEPVEMESDANYIFPDASRIQEKLTAVRQKLLESGR
jgi:hypothetical protein